MILNLSNQIELNAMQRLACNGSEVVAPLRCVKNADDFYAILDEYEKPSMIIVNPKNVVLNNDILNAVTCPVVTLSMETTIGDDDKATYNFLEYNPDET